MPVYVPLMDTKLQCAVRVAQQTLNELEEAARGGPYSNAVQNIARHLKAAGVTGLMGSAAHCPVANLIRKNVQAACGRFEIQVGQLVSSVRGGPFDNGTAITTPLGVQEFISAFDHGQIPELADNPYRLYQDW